MTDLSSLQDITSNILQDTTNLVFSDTQINEALRFALLNYSFSIPYTQQSILTLTQEGVEIPLTSIQSTIINILSVWWPWDTTLTLPNQFPNEILSFELVHDAGSSSLNLHTYQNHQPQINDQVRLYYYTYNTLTGLAPYDGGSAASATTLPTNHFPLLARGAAGYALLANTVNRDDVINADRLHKTAQTWLEQYYAILETLARRASPAYNIIPWPSMDKSDPIY